MNIQQLQMFFISSKVQFQDCLESKYFTVNGQFQKHIHVDKEVGKLSIFKTKFNENLFKVGR